MKSSP